MCRDVTGGLAGESANRLSNEASGNSLSDAGRVKKQPHKPMKEDEGGGKRKKEHGKDIFMYVFISSFELKFRE